MRARTVNEDVNFERGRNPKKSMDIGGLDLATDYQRRVDEYRQSVEGTTLSHTDEWKEFLRDTLVGKNITAEMKKLPTISKSGKTQTPFERGEFTIEVKDVLPTWGMGEDFSVHLNEGPFQQTPPKLIVADMDNNMYELSMDQKIHLN